MLFCASQAVTGIYLLLKGPDMPYSNKMLALLFISWGFSCYWFFAFIQGPPFFSKAVTTFIGPMISLTLFPPIYLYIKYLFYEYKSFRKSDHLHFLPVYIFIVFTIFLFWAGDFTIIGMREHPLYHSRTIVCSYIAMIQGPCYFYATNRLMKIRHKKLLQEFSDIERKKLQWLRVINYSFVLIFVLGGISTIFRTTHINPYYLYLGYHFVMGVSLFYITLKIFALPELFSSKAQISEVSDSYYNYAITAPITLNIPKSVAQTIPIKEEEKSVNFLQQETSDIILPTIKDGEIAKKIEQVMKQHKLYTNPNISLHDLAKSISETRNSVSNALNNQIHKTFYDYINELRVEESKKLLADPHKANYTIEAIAAEAGFKTMSVFYRFFKDIVKVTPSQYRKKTTTYS